jgi:hypothetical protein
MCFIYQIYSRLMIVFFPLRFFRNISGRNLNAKTSIFNLNCN